MIYYLVVQFVDDQNEEYDDEDLYQEKQIQASNEQK